MSTKRDRYDLKHGQEIVIETVDGMSLSGLYQRQNTNRIEISNVKDLETEARYLFKFISKNEIVEIHNLLDHQAAEDDDFKRKTISLRKEKNEHIDKVITNKIVVKCYDMVYKQAIADISCRSVIGVALNTSATDSNHYIAIGTETNVYIFDMTRLLITYRESIKEDLRNILSSEDITKVVHDFRIPYNRLKEVYQIELYPIFDVMAVAALQGFPSNVVQNFGVFLKTLLNVEHDFVPYKSSLDPDVVIDLAQCSVYLVILHQTLSRSIFSKLLNNIDSSKNEFLDPQRERNFFDNVQINLEGSDELKAILSDTSVDSNISSLSIT